MSKALLIFVWPALLLAQQSPFSTSSTQPVQVSYNNADKPPAPSATTFTQFVVVTSSQPQTFQITATSSPQWLQYAVPSSAAQNCSAVSDSAYRSSPSPTSTGNTIKLCIRGMSAPPLANGNYSGVITIGPASGASFVPFRLRVQLTSVPNGFLQLYLQDGSRFPGGTMKVAVQNGSLALSPAGAVHCNVFDPNGASDDDGDDLKAPVSAQAFVPYTLNTIADWVVLSFNNNSTPANLSIRIDPVKAKNQPDLSATIRIHSAATKTAGVGEDFVYLVADALTTPAPNNLTVSPNPLTLSAVTGNTTLITNSVNVASTTAGLSFTAAVTSGSWLSVQNVSGISPGTFTVVVDPARVSTGPNAGTIQVTSGGAANSPVTLAVNVQASPSVPLPSIKTGGIVNAASNTAPVAPGSWVSIYGSNLSPQVPGGLDWSGAIVNSRLPFTLAGVSVTINSRPAAISYVNNSQINVQAPDDTNSGPVNVVVTTSNGISSPGVVTLQPIAPALFLNGTTFPAAQLSDYSTITATHPAHPGDSVTLYGTGFGPTSPPYPTGVLMSGSARVTNTVTAAVGNIPAPVDFAGIIGPGLYQINLRVPASAGTGNLPLVLSINGLQTQTNIFLPVIR